MIYIDGYDDPINTQFQQNGGNVEASYAYVSHGVYQIDDGLLTTTNLNVGGGASVYRPQAEGHFTQSGGHVVVYGEMKVSGSSPSGRTSSGQYEMLGGTLEVNRIWIYSEHEAIFHQTGGDVRVDFLEIEGDINRALQSVYNMEGGTLHVAKQLVVAESDNYHIGGFDFSGQPVTVSTGEQSFIKIGANATFGSAENATLQIGPNSIMTIPESLDLGAIFGTYERNNAIYYHEGEPVYVGPGERAQIAGWDLFHDGFVVDGLVYDDPSRGAADVQGLYRSRPRDPRSR